MLMMAERKGQREPLASARLAAASEPNRAELNRFGNAFWRLNIAQQRDIWQRLDVDPATPSIDTRGHKGKKSFLSALEDFD